MKQFVHLLDQPFDALFCLVCFLLMYMNMIILRVDDITSEVGPRLHLHKFCQSSILTFSQQNVVVRNFLVGYDSRIEAEPDSHSAELPFYVPEVT